MEERLIELGFAPCQEYDLVRGFNKAYGNIHLFVASFKNNENWMASVMVGKTEVSIPGKIDLEWINNFHLNHA